MATRSQIFMNNSHMFNNRLARVWFNLWIRFAPGTRLRSGGLFIAMRDVALVLNILRSLVLARLLTPELFGIVALGTSIALAARRFNTFGFSSAAIRDPGDERSVLSTQFWVEVVLEFVVFAAVLAAAPLIGHIYGQSVSNIAVLASLLLLIASFNSMPTTALERRRNFNQLALLEGGRALCGFAVPVGLALGGWGIWSLLAAFGTEFLAGFLILWFAFRPVFPRLAVDMGVLRRFLKFARGYWGAEQLQAAFTIYDRLILGVFANATSVGLYSFGMTIANYPFSLLNEPLERILYPTFVAGNKNGNGLGEIISDVLLVVLSISSLLAVALLVSVEPLIRTILGDQWLPAIPTMQVLFFNGVLRQIVSLLRPVIFTLSEPTAYFRASLAAVVVFVPLAPLGAWALGSIGVALAILAANLVMSLFFLWKVERLVGISIGEVLSPILASIVSALLVLAVLQLPGSEHLGFTFRLGLLLLAIALFMSILLLLTRGRILQAARRLLGLTKWKERAAVEA